MAAGPHCKRGPGRFAAWFDRWSKRRAEKNRRFKIPCHLGVKPGRADDQNHQTTRGGKG
ncbi:hypothetical protein [Paracoccus sp. SCSIO 75233]|uniref:hypothetical protein n=1 Tax=Paracoccus sp. SCSIO 75233 TaxID=3017782 RepID=UPI0022F06616|nr:hypothetical protein [Paracoccus sp. SCSIO 75233]WBU54719.1 hypothetical protein PAF12_07805 [Paracoccus sp. SCSIO 75233]